MTELESKICRKTVIIDENGNGRECASRVFKLNPEVDVCFNCYDYFGGNITEESIQPHRHTDFGRIEGVMGPTRKASFLGFVCENGHAYGHA